MRGVHQPDAEDEGPELSVSKAVTVPAIQHAQCERCFGLVYIECKEDRIVGDLHPESRRHPNR